MSMGCPECGSLQGNVHSPLCGWGKQHPRIAEMTNEGCVIDRDWAMGQIVRVLDRYTIFNPANDLPIAAKIVDALAISHLPSLGDERVRQLRRSVQLIGKTCAPTHDGDMMVGDAPLFDYCEQALDHDLSFEADLQARHAATAAFQINLLGDTSFPFLQIARAFGVDYGDVVRCASAFEKERSFLLRDIEVQADDSELASCKTIMSLSNGSHITAAIDAAMHKERVRRHG